MSSKLDQKGERFESGGRVVSVCEIERVCVVVD